MRKPSAFISSNWAGLVAGATLVGVGPGLAGVMRVVTSLDRHADEGFAVPMRQLRATWRRDLPISLLVVIATVLAAVNVFAVTQVESSVRVAVVGFLVPVVWAVCVFATAYVVAASVTPWTAGRDEVLRVAAMVIHDRPLRALLSPLVLVAVVPLVVLPPITIACGLSLSGWVIGEWFGARGWRLRLDPHPDDAVVDTTAEPVVAASPR